MTELLEWLKYILPALLVFAICIYTQKRFFEQEEKRRIFELQKNSAKIATPIRFRAYERLILFLERITPENLVLRVQQHDMDAMHLHTELLKTIRMEYEHNLSQQLYVSQEAWSLVVTAKESLIRILNTTVTRINPSTPALALSKEFIEDFHDSGKSPLEIAKHKLQKEVSQYF